MPRWNSTKCLRNIKSQMSIYTNLISILQNSSIQNRGNKPESTDRCIPWRSFRHRNRFAEELVKTASIASWNSKSGNRKRWSVQLSGKQINVVHWWLPCRYQNHHPASWRHDGSVHGHGGRTSSCKLRSRRTVRATLWLLPLGGAYQIESHRHCAVLCKSGK